MNTTSINTDKLVADLKLLATDAEELLRLTAGQAGDKVSEVRARLGEQLEQVKVRVGGLEDELLERGRQVADATDSYVRDNPWKAVGAVGGVAFLLGLLIGRR